ncbi:ABC transporter permease subunit [Suicoccus acidiformans]|nr:ABC transporter permease subunit [Suicoccus acidiformans]
MKWRRWVLVLCMLLGLSAPGWVSAQEEVVINPAEPLIIGLDPTFAPYGYEENGEMKGFDIEIAAEVFDEMGMEYKFQPIDWGMKEQELYNGNIDMIWNGYSVSPERKQQVAFSKPYIEGRVGILVREDSDIRTKADLAGKVVATQEGSSQLEAIQADEAFIESIGELVTFSSFNEVLAELESGRADAIVIAELVTRYYFTQNGQGEHYRMLEEDFGVTETAVGFRKSDTAFVEEFDAALDKVMASDAYDESYNRWFAEIGGDSSESQSRDYWGPLFEGLKTTIFFFVVTLVLSIPLGLLIALLEQSGPRWFKAVVQVYVYIFRGSPLLLQLMIIYFGLPFIGFTPDRVESALFTMVINYAAYLVEIFRGGLNSIPEGQYEALRVLSIDRWTGLRRVIIPQLWKIVMPSVGNEVISLVKDTSLVYILGLNELLKAGRALSTQYASLVPYLNVGIIYLVFTGIVTLCLRYIERRIQD